MKILPTRFDNQTIWRVSDEAAKTWWFSMIDVVQLIPDSSNSKRYWPDHQRKVALGAGSKPLHEKIVRLKMLALDGK